MSLVQLIYAKNTIERIDYVNFPELSFDEFAQNAQKQLRIQTRFRFTRGFVSKSTLQERIEKVRLRLIILRKGDPIPLLSRQYRIGLKDEKNRLVRVNPIYKQLRSTYLPFFNQNQRRSVILGQALELANELQGAGYYVFTHGQSLRWGAYSDLITAKWKRQQSHQVDAYHRKWRIEGAATKWMNVDDFSLSKDSQETDHRIRKSIISVDAILSSSFDGESAFYWYLFGCSNHTCTYSESFSKIESGDLALSRELHAFDSWLESLRTGRINVIAIPKHLLRDEKTCFVYRAHSLGKKCLCYGASHETFIKELENHQAAIVNGCLSQYRILVDPLNTHEGVRTFSMDDLSSEDRMLFEQKKASIIQKLC